MIPLPRSLCDDTPVDPEIKAAVDAAIEIIRSRLAEVRGGGIADAGGTGAAPDRLRSLRLYAQHLAPTPERYDKTTRATILAGRDISNEEAERLRHDLQQHRVTIRDAFASVDLVMLPTLPRLPLTIREAIEPFALPALHVAFSLGGLPSISVPCGYSRSGLPIGLLIGGPPLSEPRIFALAQTYEGMNEWRHRRPPL